VRPCGDLPCLVIHSYS